MDRTSSKAGTSTRKQARPCNRVPAKRQHNASLKDTTEDMRFVNDLWEHGSSQPLSTFNTTPPWQTLPYHILFNVFRYAAEFLHDDASHSGKATSWLVCISTLSKSVHEAAISVLLYCPPLLPLQRARRLIQLLECAPDRLSLPYANKIKCLHIEAEQLLAKKQSLNLLTLLVKTPMVKSINIYHSADLISYRPEYGPRSNWRYPSNLFDMLDENRICLNEWSWNQRFATGSTVRLMAQMHGRDCLKNLKSLTILNTTEVKERSKLDQSGKDDTLRRALQFLPNLGHLQFQNCQNLDGMVLSSLPSNLLSLTIRDCHEVTSDDLESCLCKHGRELRTLRLAGNRNLDFNFGKDLQNICPHLYDFYLNMTFIEDPIFQDTTPWFLSAFPESHMPAWPRSLGSIRIENLRNLRIRDAERFLLSLTEAGPELQNLRILSIRILLNDDSWRDRAHLRQKWLQKVEKTFLKKTKASNFRSLKERETVSSEAAVRRSDIATKSQRRSARIAPLGRHRSVSYGSVIDAAKTSAPPDEPLSGSIQGLCSSVTVHIDGQRPARDQFNEADFLDDERSGDEDWNGRDPDSE